jgi:ankyrin repeat protein
LPSLNEVLRKVNESVDDFREHPATTASDQGAFEDYPLHKVAIWGDIPSATVLLASGADINVAGEDGDTPLHRAIAGGHAPMIRYLISKGASVLKKNRYGQSPKDDAEATTDESIIRAFDVDASEPP